MDQLNLFCCKNSEAIYPSCYFTEICTLLFNTVNILEHKIKPVLSEEGEELFLKRRTMVKMTIIEMEGDV